MGMSSSRGVKIPPATRYSLLYDPTVEHISSKEGSPSIRLVECMPDLPNTQSVCVPLFKYGATHCHFPLFGMVFVNPHSIVYIQQNTSIMPKQRRTGKKAGSAASKVLKDKRTSKKSKTAAGSALSQRAPKKRKK